MHWDVASGSLEVAVQPSVTAPTTDYSTVQPGLKITSPGMCRALYEV